MTREDLIADQQKYRELYEKTIADANALKGCLQYIDLKLAELPAPTPEQITPAAPAEPPKE